MFSGDDEDGDFLSPSGGAKLASLFGLDQETSQGNESFQYTAPKQPRKNSNPAPAPQKAALSPGAPAVLFATAVQAFRYINGQYVKQGKLGAAVLGNHTTKEYKLLLYLSQQKQVTAARIHTGFVFTVQSNNYCTFYDDQRQNWSLMFESEKASSDFCKEVGLAKANSIAILDTVVVQDLSLGEGQVVENGDILEVAYAGWLLQNYTIGQMFDSNQNKDKLLRLKIGAGKVIKGWEEGMLGMKKAGRRLIIIPPTLACGSKSATDGIPANSTLIFEAVLKRVKFSKDSVSDRASASSRDSAAPSPAHSPAPTGDNLTTEPPVLPTSLGPCRPEELQFRAKSSTVSEQLSVQTPDATKAKLISRMAKMGQPMLPFLTGVTCQPESSDSELEETTSARAKDELAAPSPVQICAAAPGSAHAHPHPHIAPPSAVLPVMSNLGAQPGLQGNTHAFQPYSYAQTSMAPTQLQPVGQVYPSNPVSYMACSDVTSFLMTEARQHNTEIRLAVGKVADKVDQLATKIDDLQRQGVSIGLSGISMETSMIMHNIQRIVQENECLKKEVFEKSSRIEEQNHKISELINQNQRYMEQSNLLLEQRNDSLKTSSEQNQARRLQAEQDKVRLSEELASSTARLSQLQLEASSHQQKAMELQTKLSSALQDTESHCHHITALETQMEELKVAAERAQANFRTEKQRRKEMELRINNMEEEVQDLRSDKESLEQTLIERKNKWQAERLRWDEEMEELRKSNQQELDNIRVQLRKARTNTDNVAPEQLQAELEDEWKRRCEHALGLAKEQNSSEIAKLTEQRDALEEKLTELQEKVQKQSRDSEEQSLHQHQEQAEELQALQLKYSSLEQQGAALKEKLERRVAELEKKLKEKESSTDIAAEVKRVMNGVFHSLRGEFDLSESYSGQAVLGVIVSTIKDVTLQLLSGQDRSSTRPSRGEALTEGEEEPESDSVQIHQTTHVNGISEAELEETDEAKSKCLQIDQEAAAAGLEMTLKTQIQSEDLETTPPLSSTESKAQAVETAVAGSPMEQNNKAALPGNTAGVSVLDKQCMDDEEKLGEKTNSDSLKSFGPPSQPPPPPNVPESSPGRDISLTEGMAGENGEGPFFQSTPPAKPPAAPSMEEEEDELSLKGRPPPTPLFGEDEDDEDLDWLS
ncbi:FK506-binding protein 15 [Aulostomus maculatus]